MTTYRSTRYERTVLLAEHKPAQLIPYVDQLASPPRGAMTWCDYGDVLLTPTGERLLEEVRESRQWDPQTRIAVARPMADPRPHPAAPTADEETFMFGYVLRFTEPGVGAREVRLSTYKRGRKDWQGHAYVALTASENRAEREAAYKEGWAALTPQERAQRVLSYVATQKRALRDDEKALNSYLQAAVLDALECGVPAADVARWAELSVPRIYQIRDGR